MWSLTMLLWLSLEFMIVPDAKYPQYHAYISLFALIIPILMIRQVVKEKRDELGGISLKKAFTTGLIVTALAAIFSIPTSLMFHFFVNPDYFNDMINYAVTFEHQKEADAAKFFNLTTYLIISTVSTLVLGTIIAIIAAWRMKTVKHNG